MNKIKINIDKIMEEICNLNIKDLKNKNKFEKIQIFLDIIKIKDPSVEKTISLIYNFIKKINKNTITKNKINNDLLLKKNNFDNMSSIKIINKLFDK